MITAMNTQQQQYLQQQQYQQYAAAMFQQYMQQPQPQQQNNGQNGTGVPTQQPNPAAYPAALPNPGIFPAPQQQQQQDTTPKPISNSMGQSSNPAHGALAAGAIGAVSRFTPPPPPPVGILELLLKDGAPEGETRESTDSVVAQILHRWNAKLDVWIEVHPGERPSAPCPPASQYTTVSAWMEKVTAWYTANFGTRATLISQRRGRNRGGGGGGGRGGGFNNGGGGGNRGSYNNGGGRGNGNFQQQHQQQPQF